MSYLDLVVIPACAACFTPQPKLCSFTNKMKKDISILSQKIAVLSVLNNEIYTTLFQQAVLRLFWHVSLPSFDRDGLVDTKNVLAPNRPLYSSLLSVFRAEDQEIRPNQMTFAKARTYFSNRENTKGLHKHKNKMPIKISHFFCTIPQ